MTDIPDGVMMGEYTPQGSAEYDFWTFINGKDTCDVGWNPANHPYYYLHRRDDVDFEHCIEAEDFED